MKAPIVLPFETINQRNARIDAEINCRERALEDAKRWNLLSGRIERELQMERDDLERQMRYEIEDMIMDYVR